MFSVHGVLGNQEHISGIRRLPVTGIGKTNPETPESRFSGHCCVWPVIQLPGNSNTQGMYFLEPTQSFAPSNPLSAAFVKKQ